MKNRVSIGIIGLGRMGQIYARHLAGHGQVRIAYVSDVIEERAAQLAEEFGVESWTSDYRDILHDRSVDAIFVTSSTSTHREVVIAAAEAGKAIFCEKPIALTLEDTDEMIKAIERRGVMFQAGFMRRFDRGYAAARLKIEAGAIGEPVTFK